MTAHNGKIAGKEYKWVGPYKLDSLSKNVLNDNFCFPHGKIVYIVTLKTWVDKPTKENFALYVGQSGKSNEFQARARLGSLISNILGFFNIDNNKRHKGGESIFNYCKINKIKPFNLYISWKNTEDLNNEENNLIDDLNPIINKRKSKSI